MKRRNFNVIGYDTRYWWLLLVGGLFFIIIGLWIIFSQPKSYLFLSMLLSVGMLVTEAFETLFSFINRKQIGDWGWIFSGGMIDFLVKNFNRELILPEKMQVLYKSLSEKVHE